MHSSLANEAGAADVEASGPVSPAEPWAWRLQQQLGAPILFRAALVVAPLWFMAQYTFNSSLSRTTVTSNTILSSTSSLFTYGLSWAVLREPFAPLKLVAILLCMAGTALVVLADRSKLEGPNTMLGDLLCLISASFYACYTIAIRRMLSDDKHTNTMLFFGYVGALNAVCLAPLLVILQLAGLFDNVLSDYLWARAVLLVGPTIATVGLSIQVPFAVVLDLALTQPEYAKHASSIALMVVGALAVLAGLFGINIDTTSSLALVTDVDEEQ